MIYDDDDDDYVHLHLIILRGNQTKIKLLTKNE